MPPCFWPQESSGILCAISSCSPRFSLPPPAPGRRPSPPTAATPGQESCMADDQFDATVPLMPGFFTEPAESSGGDGSPRRSSPFGITRYDLKSPFVRTRMSELGYGIDRVLEREIVW